MAGKKTTSAKKKKPKKPQPAAKKQDAKKAQEAVPVANKPDITISENLLLLIACKATTGVDGVASMSGGLFEEITSIIRRGDIPKGVSITREKGEVSVHVSVEIEYGKPIPKIAADIQKAVTDQLKELAGLDVSSVKVNVSGAHIEHPPVAKDKK